MPDDLPPDETALWADAEDGSDGVWAQYQSKTDFPTDLGLMAIPVAGPDGTPPMVVKTHAKVATKQVSWRAMKHGMPPAVPCPEAADDNEVMLSAVVTPVTPQLLSNGLAQTWSIAGTYTYVLLRPLDPCGRGLPGGGDPRNTVSLTSNVYPADKFRHDLLMGTNPFTET